MSHRLPAQNQAQKIPIVDPFPTQPQNPFHTISISYVNVTKNHSSSTQKDFLVNIFTETIIKISVSDYLKETLTLALTTMLHII